MTHGLFRRHRALLFTGIVFCLLHFSAFAEMRFWHDIEGNEYQGEYSKEVFGKIFLRGVDERLFSIPSTQLIPSDLEYLRGVVIPKMKARVRVSKKTMPSGELWAWDGWREDEIEATVTIQKMNKLPYAGRLPGELFLIGQEVQDSESYRLFASKKFMVEFPDERNNEFETELYTRLVINYIEFNAQERGCSYEGYVVVVADPDGNTVLFDTDISFISEDKLDELRKLTVPGWFNRSVQRASVPRPRPWELSESESAGEKDPTDWEY